jgi:hypothetical protein
MDPDLLLVIGIVVGALALPSLIAAFAESRPPRTATILGLTAAVLIVLAVQGTAQGYRIADIPDVFVRVFARYVH